MNDSENVVLEKGFVDGVIEHMNTDHADSLRDYAIAFAGVKQVEQVRLQAIDCLEMRLVCNSAAQSREVIVPLLNEIKRPEQLRGVLVAMAKRARQIIAHQQE